MMSIPIEGREMELDDGLYLAASLAFLFRRYNTRLSHQSLYPGLGD